MILKWIIQYFEQFSTNPSDDDKFHYRTQKNNGEIFSSNSEADSELLENISSVSYGGC